MKPSPEPAILSWSGGKDSTIALEEVLRSKELQISTLLTSVTGGYERISIHGVRRSLLEQQVRSLRLPLETVELSPRSSNEEYEERYGATLLAHRAKGIKTVVYGDLFLEEIRRYREAQLGKLGMRAIFPLWYRDTTELARGFIERGYRAVLTCIDGQALGEEFAGREFDATLLRDLPPEVDPCGENGEFHTFVYDGPLFAEAVRFERGEVVLRDKRFWYCDLTPSPQSCPA